MRGLLSNLTAFFLTVHTVFGCCWHHEHCGALGCPPQCPPGHESVHIIADSHSCDGDHQSEGKKHVPQQCKGPSCVFMGLLSSKIVQSERTLSPAIFLTIRHECFSTAITPEGGFFLPAGQLPPPIRLNLVNQVLLI